MQVLYECRKMECDFLNVTSCVIFPVIHPVLSSDAEACLKISLVIYSEETEVLSFLFSPNMNMYSSIANYKHCLLFVIDSFL